MPESYYNEAEIQAIIDEFGVAVVIAGVTSKGIVDRIDEELLAGMQTKAMGRMISVIVKTGTFPGLVERVQATVEGTVYRVREIMRLDDGALTKFLCAVEAQ